jgi:hypothetical protein
VRASNAPAYRTTWLSTKTKQRKPIGLAAFKAQQARRERQRIRRELAAAKRQRRRLYWEGVSAHNRRDENQPGRPMRLRAGPLSRAELYEWHKAMGTLQVYFSMFLD